MSSRPTDKSEMRCAICGARTSEDRSLPITEDQLFELGMVRVTQPPLRIDETCAYFFHISQPPKEATMKRMSDVKPEDGQQIHFQEFEDLPGPNEPQSEDFDLRDLYENKYRGRVEDLLRELSGDGIPVHMVFCLAQEEDGNRSFLHQLFSGHYLRTPVTMLVARKLYEDESFRSLVVNAIRFSVAVKAMADGIYDDEDANDGPRADEASGDSPAGDYETPREDS